MKILGEGTFGVVIKAFDNQNRKLVAIKISKGSKMNSFLKNEYNNLRTLNDVDPLHSVPVLEYHRISMNFFKDPCNKKIGYLSPRSIVISNYGGKEVYRALMRTKAVQRPFTDFMHLFCQAIGYWKNLQRNRLVQRDIKPQNMLIDGPFETPGSLKFIDPSELGEEGDPSNDYYASTRYYRSPAILSKRFSAEEVPFALGTTFYALLTKFELFPSDCNLPEPRETKMQRHLQIVFDTFGQPSLSFFKSLPEEILKTFFVQTKKGFTFKLLISDSHQTKKNSKEKELSRKNKIKERIEMALNRYYKEKPSQRLETTNQLTEVFSLLCQEKPITPDELLQHPLFKKYASIVKTHVQNQKPDEDHLTTTA